MKTGAFEQKYMNYLIWFVKSENKITIYYSRSTNKLIVSQNGFRMTDFYFLEKEFNAVMKAKRVYENKRQNKSF